MPAARIKTAYTIFSVVAATILFVSTLGRQFYANNDFDQEPHWVLSNLTYNATHVASVGQGWELSSTAISSQCFFVLAIILGSTLFFLYTTRHQLKPITLYLTLATTFCLMLAVMMWLVLYTPSPVIKDLDIQPPWSLSFSGDLWLDYRRRFRRFRMGGHHLRVDCPDGSTLSSEAYGRIVRHFTTDTPDDVPVWPWCADYYSDTQSKLYRMCCAARTVLQHFDPEPVFSTSQTIFLASYLTYLLGLLMLGVSTRIIHQRARHSVSRRLSQLRLNPLSSAE